MTRQTSAQKLLTTLGVGAVALSPLAAASGAAGHGKTTRLAATATARAVPIVTATLAADDQHVADKLAANPAAISQFASDMAAVMPQAATSFGQHIYDYVATLDSIKKIEAATQSSALDAPARRTLQVAWNRDIATVNADKLSLSNDLGLPDTTQGLSQQAFLKNVTDKTGLPPIRPLGDLYNLLAAQELTGPSKSTTAAILDTRREIVGALMATVIDLPPAVARSVPVPPVTNAPQPAPGNANLPANGVLLPRHDPDVILSLERNNTTSDQFADNLTGAMPNLTGDQKSMVKDAAKEWATTAEQLNRQSIASQAITSPEARRRVADTLDPMIQTMIDSERRIVTLAINQAQVTPDMGRREAVAAISGALTKDWKQNGTLQAEVGTYVDAATTRDLLQSSKAPAPDVDAASAQADRTKYDIFAAAAMPATMKQAGQGHKSNPMNDLLNKLPDMLNKGGSFKL